ncbi:MAG: class I SAM-dependent methyltransferase [Actinomycetota bacterium]
MTTPDRDVLKQTFDGVAEMYDSARPDYPPALFDDLADLADLDPSSSILEIGCGTGKATMPLAERGFNIRCLEPGANLAALATRKLAQFPHVHVTPEPFETWDAQGSKFDLIFAATSWHWIDPETRYSKAASLLGPRGHLAFFNARHAFPRDVDPFFLELQEVYNSIGYGAVEAWIPGYDTWPPLPPEEIPDEGDEITGSGLFVHVQVRRYVWELVYDADEYLRLLDTFSGHIAMEPKTRAFLYDEIRQRIEARPEKRVRRHWLAVLHVARRTP